MNNQEKNTENSKRYMGKRIKYGAISTTITIIFIVAVVLLNIVISTLTTRYSLKFDITPQQYFEITQETVDYLKEIKEDVDIVVLADEASLSASDIYNKYLVEILYKYTKNSDKIKLEFVNPDKNPDYVSKYKSIYSGVINAGSIVITSGERIRVLTQSDIISSTVDTSTGYYNTSTSMIAEQSLTSAVMFVTNEHPVNVTVMAANMEESGISGLSALLEKNGYFFSLTDPATGSIPEDANIVIVPAPMSDYTEATCKRIEDFLYNNGKYGKNLVYFPNYQQLDTPNLDALLETWGVQVDDGYVCESDQNYYVNSPYNIISTLEAIDYTKGISDMSKPFVSVMSSPIKKLWDTQDTYTVTSLLHTSSAALSLTNEMAQNGTFDPDTAEKSVYDLMLLSSRKEVVDNVECTTNVLTISSLYCVDASFLTSTSFVNGEYVLSIFNTLTGKTEDGITIVPKNVEQYSIAITESAAAKLKWIMVIGIPVVILIIGIVIWARRRNR